MRSIVALIAVIVSRAAVAAVVDVPAGDVPALVAAIAAANASAEDDTINLAPGEVYSLPAADNGVNGLPVVTSKITIVGSASVSGGPDSSIARAPGAVASFRIVEVAPSGDLTFEHVVLMGGRLTEPGDHGGGIRVDGGKLALVSSQVNANRCGDGCLGGGLFVAGASPSVAITDSSFSNNQAAEGGAIQLSAAATVTITRSRLVVNSVTVSTGSVYGGGISASAPANVTIVESTIGGNTAGSIDANAEGAGISDRGMATWTIERSTIVGNTISVPNGDGLGGGIGEAGGATFTIVNSTISSNAVFVDWLGRAEGGGISAQGGGSWSLSNVTIARNAVDRSPPLPLVGTVPAARGGGVALDSGTFHVRNTIIADNTTTADPPLPTAGPDCFTESVGNPQTLVSDGYSLIENSADCSRLAGPGDVTGVDPMLDELAVVEGGPTALHVLLSCSPAIEAGSPGPVGSGGDACEIVDQRGVTRPVGKRCDIGSYERAPDPLETCETSTSTTTSTTTLPGCRAVATFESIECRLDALVTRLQAASDLGRLQNGLVMIAAKVREKLQAAEGLGGAKKQNNVVKKAVRRLSILQHRLKSRSARKIIPDATRMPLLGETRSIYDDLKQLRAALG